ncbi:SdpI family protein [Brevibacterium litoralis]|uniref:SdpI family protein n=1 Tax=Brevibacterium litoralis TaxID=3138935 RepID=UPI0032F073F3
MDGEVVGRAVVLVVMVASGVLLIWQARATACGRLGRNQVAGIRLPSTLESDAAWRAAHVRAERPTTLAGVVSILSGLGALLPIPLGPACLVVFAGAVIMLGIILYAARVASRAAEDAGT